MLKTSNIWVDGWKHAIRGMRNPMNSWDKSDSDFGCYTKEDINNASKTPYLCKNCDVAYCDKKNKDFLIGPNDAALMYKLCTAGSDHRKFMRQIFVSMDIIAPLYWWKEFSTYKIGTVANSCSTMHTIVAKPFVKEDFSYEHLCKVNDVLMTDFNEFIGIDNKEHNSPYRALNDIIEELNQWRDFYIYYKNRPTEDIEKHNENLKTIWWQLIQLLPSSYNQKRTVTLNYEVLNTIYAARKNHKLDEWREFCSVISTFPMSSLITH